MPSSPQPSESRQQPALAKNQQLIWLGQQLHRDVPLYEVPYLYTIRGPIDALRFARACRTVVKQNDVLRIVASDDSWHHPLLRSLRDVECGMEDVSTAEDPLKAAETIVKNRLAGRFDPTQSLCDSTLICLDVDHWQFHLTLHHVLTDALGGQAFLSNLVNAYESNLQDSLPVANQSYRRYVEQQDQLVQESAFDKHRRWFNDRIESTDATGFYCSAAGLGKVQHTRIVVPLRDDENAAIARLVNSPTFRRITPALSHFDLFTTVMMAWLYRLDQRQSFCIGATTHGRTSNELRETIGLFMQLLPFRVLTDSRDTFETLSRKIAAESMGFLANSRPGVMTATSQRAFDVAINVIDLNVQDFCGMPTSMQWLHNGYGDPERKLTLSAHALPSERWELLFDFEDGAFTAVDRDKAVAHFRQTLAAMDDVQSLISQYPLLTAADQSFLSTHSGAANVPEQTHLWTIFTGIAERQGDATAVSGPKLQLTYAGLHLMGQELAERIESAKCGDVVPLLCRRNEQAIIGMVGIIASGRCFLIIDADDPIERRNQLLKQSGARLMVDAAGDEIRVRPTEQPETDACALTKDACYILFTSGSTGHPNGVVVGHESIWNLLTAFEELAPLDNQCRCSWWTNVGFDVGIYEVFSALLFGRTLCIPDQSQRLSPEEMLRWMQTEEIDSGYLPPFFLEAADQFLAVGESLSLRRLLVGVDSIPQRLLASIAGRLPELNLINGYGPTETTVCATLHRINSDDHSDRSASIGRPLSGNQIQIVDSSGTQVPAGVPGELWIGGVGLAKGYLADPELTQQRFVSRTNGPDQGTWYRSGDRVRQRDDGSLDFLGRVDDQIKLAGIRIEPGEIASLVRGHEGVEDCCVLSETVDGKVKHLIAFIEGKSDVDIVGIRRHLRKRLPPTVVPTRFILQRPLPRNSNGKIDRAALRQLLAEHSAGEHPPEQPSSELPNNATEFTLVAIVRDVLMLPGIGIDDDFFELGGSSLDAMNVVSKSNSLGIDLAIEDIFRHRTISEISTSVLEKSERSEASPPPNQTRLEWPNTELSADQRAIWYHAQTHPDSAAYHFQIRWSCNGRLDVERVVECFRELAARHPVLRTTIQSENGTPSLVIHDELLPSIQTWDHDSTIDQIIAVGQRPFDLSRDSPLRVTIVQPPGGASTTLAITVHHVAFDQQSIALLMSEFSELYKGVKSLCLRPGPASNGITPGLTDSQATNLQWWKEWLTQCDRTIPLPVDFATPVNDSDKGELLRFSLAGSLSDSIRKTAADLGVSVSTILLCGYAFLLSRYSACEKFTVGFPVNGRDQSNDNQIGFFVHALPLACRVPTSGTFDDWIRKVQIQFADFLEQRQSSHQELSESMGHLYETMFVPQQSPPTLQLPGDLELTPEVSDLGYAKYDLTWFATDAQPNIECAVEYRVNRFKPETIQLMTRHWQTLLEQLVAEPNCEINEVDFRTEVDFAAENALAVPQNDESNSEDNVCVCELISERAITSPADVAVICGSDSISYRELLERSSRLAMDLHHAGASPGDPIVLCLSRSIQTIVGMAGILKAGCAYVPLDPNQPRKRLRDTATRVGAKIVVGDDESKETFDHVLVPGSAKSMCQSL